LLHALAPLALRGKATVDGAAGAGGRAADHERQRDARGPCSHASDQRRLGRDALHRPSRFKAFRRQGGLRLRLLRSSSMRMYAATSAAASDGVPGPRRRTQGRVARARHPGQDASRSGPGRRAVKYKRGTVKCEQLSMIARGCESNERSTAEGFARAVYGTASCVRASGRVSACAASCWSPAGPARAAGRAWSCRILDSAAVARRSAAR
jgi:hypothetical protein